MDLKTIVLDSRPSVAERQRFNLGCNDGQRVESAARDAGEESWAGAVLTVDFLAAGRAEMRLLDNPGPVQI